MVLYNYIYIYIEDTSLHLLFAGKTNGEGAQELGVSTTLNGTHSFCEGFGNA